jgi:NAD(P)-dependent dehydrogenase (short-subunit alcohol dehydrogenase family)
MSDLSNKVVVVTGAAGGMGQAIVKMLAEAGAKLGLADLNEDALTKVAGTEVVVQPTDVTDDAQVKSFFDAVSEKFGKINAVINLPGMSIAARVADMPVEDYDKIIDVNLKSAFLVAKYFVPVAAPSAQLIYMSSMASRRANPNAPVYCAAKAAVTMLAEGLALQLMNDDIRVTGLRPGPTDTDGFWGTRPVPREKFMSTGNIAEVVRFVLTLPEHIVVHEMAFESFAFFKK